MEVTTIQFNELLSERIPKELKAIDLKIAMLDSILEIRIATLLRRGLTIEEIEEKVQPLLEELKTLIDEREGES